jgi:hypothetical protein
MILLEACFLKDIKNNKEDKKKWEEKRKKLK